MKIEISIDTNTTLTIAKNSCDEDSSYELARFINNQVVGSYEDGVIIAPTKDYGNIKFSISIDGFDDDNFKCTVLLKAIVDNIDIDDVYNAYDSLENDAKFTEYITAKITEYIQDINKKLGGYLKFPENETFLFKGDDFYIKMSPYSSYTPEFKDFAIEEEIDSDQIAANIHIF